MPYNPLIDFVAGYSTEERLVNQQCRTNDLMQQQNYTLNRQVEELNKRNKILEQEIANKEKEAKKTKWFNIITIIIAGLSLIVSIVGICI